MTGKSDIAGYILAGGKGRRMGGKEKLYLQYEGKYLALRTMEALDMLENHYISVADIPKIRIRNAQWITDLYKDEGPLGGILSGLLQCPEKALFVVPCDMFGLERNLAERMIQAYIRKGKPVFLKGREEMSPFPGIYTKEMIPIMKRQRTLENYRMRSLFEMEEAKEYIYLNETEVLVKLVNLNTEEDLQRLNRRSNGQESINGKRGTGTDSK